MYNHNPPILLPLLEGRDNNIHRSSGLVNVACPQIFGAVSDTKKQTILIL